MKFSEIVCILLIFKWNALKWIYCLWSINKIKLNLCKKTKPSAHNANWELSIQLNIIQRKSARQPAKQASKRANKPSHLYIYRMHSTINIIQIEWGSQWTLQFCWQIDILSSLHECLSVFCGWLYRFSHIHFMVCCFYSPINKCACNNTHSTQYTHTYFVSAAKFMDLSVGKYRTTLMVHTQQIYTTC